MSACTCSRSAAIDFNAIETNDYASVFTAAEQLGIQDRDQLFRRMVFNVVASNNDDHSKNHAFLMTPDGTWTPSPAYDVTFAYNPASPWTAKHLMSVNGEFEHVTMSDLHAVGDRFAIRGYRRIIREVTSAVKNWREFAAEAGLPEERTREVAARLDELELG